MPVSEVHDFRLKLARSGSLIGAKRRNCIYGVALILNDSVLLWALSRSQGPVSPLVSKMGNWTRGTAI